MNQALLKRAKYLAEYYQLEFGDIVEDCRVTELEFREWHTFGIVYLAVSTTSQGDIYKIGKSYWQGRIYQLNTQYPIGTDWILSHTIYSNDNGLVEKVLHYVFGGPGQVMKSISRELFVLSPNEVEWMKKLVYIDGRKLASEIIRAHTKAMQLHGVRGRYLD